MSVNDAKHAYLLVATSNDSGHIDDLEQVWLINLIIGPTTGLEQVNDLYNLWYDEAGISAGALPDRHFEYLRGKGYEGTLNDMWYQFWTDVTPISASYFLFNGDGIIGLPGVTLDCTKPSVIEYTMTRTDVAIANMDMWGFDDGSTYGRLRELDFRLFRGGSGANFVTATYERNILYDIEERMEIAGQLVVNVRLHGQPTVIATDGPRVVGALGVRNAMQVGGRVSGFGFIGRISDFRIHDDLGLAHHWPIDEGAGTVINDIVGGANGTLSPGTGSWVNP